MNVFAETNRLYNDRNYRRMAVFVKYLNGFDMNDHWFRFQRDYAQAAWDVMRGLVWIDAPKAETGRRAVFGQIDANTAALGRMVEGERYRFVRVNPEPAPTMSMSDVETMSAERAIDAVYVGVREDRAVFSDITVYSAFVAAEGGMEVEDVEFLSETQVPLAELRANYRIDDAVAVADGQLALEIAA